MAGASSTEQIVNITVNALIENFAKLLAIPAVEVDPYRRVSAFGIDSMVALELRYWIAREFGASLSVLDITTSKGLQNLAETVADSILDKRGNL